MKGFVFAGLLMLPGTAMAQAECDRAIFALLQVVDRLRQISDAETDNHARMLDMAERIGGVDGAALDVRASRHLTTTTARISAAEDAVTEAVAALSAYCAP